MRDLICYVVTAALEGEREKIAEEIAKRIDLPFLDEKEEEEVVEAVLSVVEKALIRVLCGSLN